jgi:hypothetical protein
MLVSRDNAAATDLWQQVFKRLTSAEDAALIDPTYDPTLDREKMAAALREAGWSEAEIEERHKAETEHYRNAPVTSPGINPGSEVFMQRLCHDVEQAMSRLGLSSQNKVATGIEPRLGPYAAKTNVVMTDESIITVGTHTFRYCGLIARAIARTIHLNPWSWEGEDFDEAKARRRIEKEPALIEYWMRIFASYALTGTNVHVPYRPANKNELMLFEQIARSMEIFAIAHEYGHHHLMHGKDISDDPHAEEFAADQFALKICYEVENVPFLFPNPYLSSGTGGVALLESLNILRSVEGLLVDRTNALAGTHPETHLRIAKFDSVAIMRPTEFVVLRGFRLTCTRILSLVRSILLDALRELSPELIKGMLVAEQ